VPKLFLYDFADFATAAGAGLPTNDSGAGAAGQTYIYGGTGGGRVIDVGDNDSAFQDDSRDPGQVLAQPVTIGGITYPAGAVVSNEYSLNPTGGNRLFVVKIGGVVVGVASLKPLAPGTCLPIPKNGVDDNPAIGYPALFICFTPGVLILTPRGEVPVETIRPGDLVLTADDGPQPVVWTGRTTVAAAGANLPVRIPAGALGNRRDLVVSPQHRMLLRGWRGDLMFGEPEAFASAVSLAGMRGIARDSGRTRVTYLHIMFDRHQVIFAEGAATESFHAGKGALSVLDAPMREELVRLFPELAGPAGSGRLARPALRVHEARLMAAQARPLQPA
jgi:hypothetical protein